jgi:flagellar protein FlbT
MNEGGEKRPEPKAGKGRLVLELRAGDRMLVNGAALQFQTRASIVLANEARFLFGKQLLSPDATTTPARRLYFAMQSAYVAEATDRETYMNLARVQAAEYMLATTSATIRSLLQDAIDELEAGRGWEALRRVRDLFAHDDLVLNIGQH